MSGPHPLQLAVAQARYADPSHSAATARLFAHRDASRPRIRLAAVTARRLRAETLGGRSC